MNAKYIQNNNKNKLIVIFLGFSFNKSCISHLDMDTDYDILVVNDYQDLLIDKNIFFNKEIHLLSWSLGVFIANKIMNNTNIKKAIAINGTPFGIDDKFGIKEVNFLKMIENFTEVEYEKFKKRTFLKEIIKAKNINNLPFNQAKNELEFLFSIAKEKSTNNIKWDKVIVSKNDLVFQNSAMDFFECKKEIIEAPHFPFFYFKSLSEIFKI